MTVDAETPAYKRRHISLKVKLAAALLELNWVRGGSNRASGCIHISYEQSKSMTADQIISRFHFDHYPIAHAEGGPDEPWNLRPVPIPDHKEKTAQVDIPEIAKGKRIRKKQAAHQAVLDKESAEETKAIKRKIPSRPFLKGSRLTQGSRLSSAWRKK